MKENNNILFLFTKQFPFGHSETYVHFEIEYLIKSFKKIILIPSEYFGPMDVPHRRSLDPKVEVFAINELLRLNPKRIKLSKKLENFIRFIVPTILSKDFFHNLKHFKHLSGLINHQYASSIFLGNYVNKYKNKNLFFYSYWCHNACILLGMMKAENKINRFISRAHSLDLYHEDWISKKEGSTLPFKEFKFKSLDGIFPISLHGERFLKSKFPAYSKKIKCFHLGVKDHGSSPFVYEEKKFTIVSCSSVTEVKRLDRLIEILALLKIQTHWIHFGSGNQMERIKSLASKLPSNISVDFKGQIENEKILEFYKTNSVNLFMNTSKAEGVPVSLMEAISFGIPVLASDTYGNSEIANEQTGHLMATVPNLDSTVKWIENFAKSEIFQKELRQSSRKFYENNFNSSLNYDSFIAEILKYPNP